jgi:RimJ/RimL family protein N-acetyltransferase
MRIYEESEWYLHLHIWNPTNRNKGIGLQLLKLSLTHFFEKLQVRRIISEPYAMNDAPNRTFAKLNFQLEKEYLTTPGSLNFEQEVCRWFKLP